MNAAIDKRYELHVKRLATRGDVEATRVGIERPLSELTRNIADSQRRTTTAVCIIVAAVAALQKLL